MYQQKLIPHLFRTEYSKITAVLCKLFNLKHLEIAEDIASETFLKATETWANKGIPENPTAWLYAVAKNKTKDYLKRSVLFETQIRKVIETNEAEAENYFDFSPQTISDSQLAMIFAVCNPANSTAAQICLALQILCGFSVEEIANAFLTKTETIKKRLLRARATLRNDSFQIKEISETDIKSRLNTILKTLYLLFNEGYFSKTNDYLIRKDVCAEAIRLTHILTENILTNRPQTNALLALMCYQSSRLGARMDDKGEAILLDQQDKNLWNKELIDKGNYYLVNACNGNEISKYHLEAAIAFWHTTQTDENKWKHILQLYNQLIVMGYSSVIALNRTFALAKVYGNEEAIVEAEKLSLNDNNYYHSLLGYLYADKEIDKSIDHYNKAISLTKSKAEKQTLRKIIEGLRKKENCG